MKKVILSIAIILIAGSALSQKRKSLKAKIIPVVFNGVTGKLKDFVEAPGTFNETTKTQKIGYHPKSDWGLNTTTNPNALPKGEDPALQKVYSPSNVGNKTFVQAWEGIGNTAVSPADPTVDVGPNHVVQMINGPSGSYIQVWDKNGTSLMSPVYFDNFMSMPGGAGDPIVVYDQRADRWLLSEFSTSGNNMHVAISQTADPTGAYYTYSFNAPAFPDYPKYSVWENEYIITANIGNSDIYALDRTSLLAGTAAPAQSFTMANFGTIGFQAATPVSLNGTTLPPANTPAMVMRMRDDAWTGAATDALEIWDVDIDWVTPVNSALTQTYTLDTDPHDSELCGYTSFSCIPQPSGTNPLDPLRELLMNRIHYRNFGTHESIVCAHVTDVNGADHAGIRWYELRRTGGSAGAWAIYQQGTYSPDADHRFMPSIGISASGNIGLAYNVSSSSVFPSLRYTGRQECDPLGTMTEPETVIAAGSASNNSNRYGDYNAMGLDPVDGETFYFTGMYNPASNWSTKIGKFNIAVCATTTEVQFGVSTLSVNESDATTAISTCLDYTIVNVPIQIGLTPSANADIIVSATGGTATLGTDFSLNGATLTLSGTTLTANVEVWIYNDDVVEGSENIILTYTLNANGGDAIAGATNQSVDITINDNDVALSAMTTSSIVYSEDFSTGFGLVTTNNPSGATAFQIGNTTAASSGAYSVPTTNTTDFAWLNDDACNCDQNTVDLLLPSIDLSAFSAASFTFSSFFLGNTYLGNTETAEVFVSVGGGAATSLGSLTANAAWLTQNFDLTPYVGNSNVVLSINYSDATGWLYGCSIDDLQVVGESPIGIQTVVNTGVGYTANLGGNSIVNFVDTVSNKVMMTLTNTSSFDYGCVTVEVDRSGVSALQFSTVNAADYLHSKTYKITPTNINPTGAFDITVYYEESEVAGWEGVTGNSRNNAEIVKVAGNNTINDVTPATAGLYSLSNIPATLGTYNTDVTFTSSYSSGLSGGFGVGIYSPGAAVAPTANFNSSGSTICQGGTITFSDVSGGIPTSWLWDFGDGTTSTLQNPTHTYTTFGSYTVTLTVTNASGSNMTTGSFTVVAPTSSTQNLSICQGESVTVGTSTYNSNGSYTDVLVNSTGCDSIITTNLTVNPLPQVSFTTPSVTIDTVCVYNASITLVGSPAGGTFSGTGVVGSIFDPSSAGIGSHVISYSYTDGNTCTSTSTITMVVDGCSGIPENSLSGVELFPSPNDGHFVITGLEEGTTYRVYDSKGKLILTGVVDSDPTSVLLPSVETGIYYLQAKKGGKNGRIKFLIAK